MNNKKKVEKESIWQRNKLMIFCALGVLLLVSYLSVQNVVISFQAENGEQYAAKLDYSAFGMCLRCYPGTQNSNDIVEKALFFGSGRKKTVVRAVEGLQEIAGTEAGTVLLQANGLILNSEEVTVSLVEYLNSLGYKASAIE